LVVDDNEDVRAGIVDALAEEGYSVAEAVDGLHALEIARADPPDLILLDLMMPRMNGWQFRAAQQADAALARIPVIVLSATLPEKVASLAANDYLHKPFELSDLLEAVARNAAPAARPTEPARPKTCAYEVYRAVYERVVGLSARAEGGEDAAGELGALVANLDALVGGPRIAAGLAKIDAEAGRHARDQDTICRAVCDTPCEYHPNRRR
jgi:CheY-like chemotaxis protein